MGHNGRVGVALAALLGSAAAASAQPGSSGPVARYWVSAATESGFAAGLMGANGRPDMGALMGMAAGGGPRPGAYTRRLTLQLGSADAPSGGPPEAAHAPPPGLGAGPSLPLETPERVRTEAGPPAEPGEPQPMQRPRGRMLIFWGCGEHAGPGQPYVIDFARLGEGAPFPIFGDVAIHAERPPSQDSSRTYGVWPNRLSRAAIPAQGSLVGHHEVSGNYSPTIRFDLDPAQDFMPPLTLTDSGPSAAGGRRLTWTPLQDATGYHLSLIGANGSQGGGADVVVWSSSRVRTMVFGGGGLGDYLPPGEVRRLVAAGAVLPPQAGECVLPAEVAAAAPHGMLAMIAYGDEANFAYPPRPADPRAPWKPIWTAKARFKSTSNLILGMRMPQGGGYGGYGGPQGPPPGDQPPPPPPSSWQDRAKSILQGFPFPH